MAATWSVPGRVNLIGEHVDYNGGPVLPFAIDRRTEVTVEPRSDRRVVVTSDGLGRAEISGPLRPGGGEGWVRYVAGALWAFTEATRRDLEGLDIEIVSTLPTGAGLSSSAAVECGVLCALDDAALLASNVCNRGPSHSRSCCVPFHRSPTSCAPEDFYDARGSTPPWVAQAAAPASPLIGSWRCACSLCQARCVITRFAECGKYDTLLRAATAGRCRVRCMGGRLRRDSRRQGHRARVPCA